MGTVCIICLLTCGTAYSQGLLYNIAGILPMDYVVYFNQGNLKKFTHYLLTQNILALRTLDIANMKGYNFCETGLLTPAFQEIGR